MNRTHDIPAIVLSMCLNGLGVARSLGRHGVPVIGVSRRRHDPGEYSRYVRSLWHYDSENDDVVDVLLAQAHRFVERPVLFPTTDAVVRKLAARRSELEPHYRLGLPDRETVDEVMGKRGFARRVQAIGLPAPKTVCIDDLRQLEEISAQITYPCIIKPDYQNPRLAQGVSLKTFVASNPAALLQAYQAFCEEEPRTVIQEWVAGNDGDVFFCLQYYDHDGHLSVSFGGRKIRQWPPLCGSTASCEPYASPEMVELTTRFFVNIGLRGLCSMEYKRDRQSGRLLMIEPTIGRTDLQSAIADINGVPIPYIAYRDLVGLAPLSLQPSRRSIKWVRWSADRAAAERYRTQGQLSTRDWLRSLRPPFRVATWSASDPRPFLAVLAAELQRKAKGAWRRMCRRSPAGDQTRSPLP